MPQASNFRAQVIPSICFGLVPTKDLYKRAILNRLPTLIKCFNVRFKLYAIAILLSLFNCSNWNSFRSVSPGVRVSVMCAEIEEEGILDYWCLKSRETSRQILSSKYCHLRRMHPLWRQYAEKLPLWWKFMFVFPPPISSLRCPAYPALRLSGWFVNPYF